MSQAPERSVLRILRGVGGDPRNGQCAGEKIQGTFGTAMRDFGPPKSKQTRASERRDPAGRTGEQ